MQLMKLATGAACAFGLAATASSAHAATILDLVKGGEGAAGSNSLVDDNREYLIDRVRGGIDQEPTVGQIDVGDSIRGLAIWSKLNGNPLGFGTDNNELTSVFQVKVISKVESSPGSGVYNFTFGPDPDFAEAVALGLGGRAMTVFYEQVGGNGALDYDDPTSPLPSNSIDDGAMNSPPSPEDVSSGNYVHEETFISTATDGQFFWALGYTGTVVDGVATAGAGEGWETNKAGPDSVLPFFDIDSGNDLASVNFSLNRVLTAGTIGIGEDLLIVEKASFIDPNFDVEFNGSATIEGIRNELTPFETSSQSTLTFSVIPLPPAVWLGMVLLSGMGGARALRRKLQVA